VYVQDANPGIYKTYSEDKHPDSLFRAADRFKLIVSMVEADKELSGAEMCMLHSAVLREVPPSRTAKSWRVEHEKNPQNTFFVHFMQNSKFSSKTPSKLRFSLELKWSLNESRALLAQKFWDQHQNTQVKSGRKYDPKFQVKSRRKKIHDMKSEVICP